MNKDALRKKMLKKRDALNKENVQCVSDIIADRLLDTYKDFKSWLLYIDFRNEVRTDKIIECLYGAGKKIMLPIVKGNDIFTGLYEGEGSLIKGAYQIPEPKTTMEKCDAEAVVVPGVVFDENCNRIGFGKGYYDRLLADLPEAVKIGICFDFQVSDNIKTEPHDQPLDVIITENRTIWRNR